jgi:hypothetical protein
LRLFLLFGSVDPGHKKEQHWRRLRLFIYQLFRLLQEYLVFCCLVSYGDLASKA